jgi:hypothetical protein
MKALNSLQSNSALLQELEKENRTSHGPEIKKLQQTVTFLERYVGQNC